MSKTLAQILNDQNDLVEVLVASDGEITPAIQEFLSKIELSLPQKVDGYFLVLERLEAEANYFKDRADEFLQAAKSIQSAREHLKDHLKFQMQSRNITELDGNDFRFTLTKAKPRVVIQEALIPKEYTREITETRVDKDRIADDLKIGVPVAGAHLEETVALRSGVNKAKRIKGSVA